MTHMSNEVLEKLTSESYAEYAKTVVAISEHLPSDLRIYMRFFDKKFDMADPKAIMASNNTLPENGDVYVLEYIKTGRNSYKINLLYQDENHQIKTVNGLGELPNKPNIMYCPGGNLVMPINITSNQSPMLSIMACVASNTLGLSRFFEHKAQKSIRQQENPSNDFLGACMRASVILENAATDMMNQVLDLADERIAMIVYENEN